MAISTDRVSCMRPMIVGDRGAEEDGPMGFYAVVVVDVAPVVVGVVLLVSFIVFSVKTYCTARTSCRRWSCHACHLSIWIPTSTSQHQHVPPCVTLFEMP